MGEHDPLETAVQRVDQTAKLLKETAEQLQEEREMLRQVMDTVLRHLESMDGHWKTASQHLAASTRLEAELRESVQESHRLVDKLPGKRQPSRILRRSS